MKALKPERLGNFRLQIGVVLALAAWLALPVAPAHAVTLTVTKTADTNDGTCDADCSLREAVVAGNAAGGADTIEIPGGYYKLTIAGNDNEAAVGDLDITTELTLKALGPATIDGNELDRVVNVRSTGNATLSGLWITGGSSPVGGIDNQQGTATLVSSTVSGNEATVSGGGIFNGGTMTLTNSFVTDNIASVSGGGIHNAGGSTVTLNKSIVSGNTADTDGGGINNSLGDVTLNQSTVKGNDAGFSDGGGIYNAAGDVTLNQSTVSGNHGNSGGGISNSATVTIIESTVSRNEGGGSGGGILNDGGELILTSSTVSGNDASNNGGGIMNFNTDGEMTLTSSTVSGNDAGSSGGGIQSSTGASATITDATITANRSDSDSNGSGDGGGLFRSPNTVSIGNSILAGNSDGTGTTHPDCSGGIESTDHNIIGDTTGCSITFQANDDTGVVTLGPLSFNGGPTETHSLPAGSTALDHGPTVGTGSDQRGVPRPVGAAFDTGAYEHVSCSGVLVNVVGTNAKETLTGTALADVVLALGGNDTVRSGDGNDKVCGGKGKDKLFGEKGSDKLLGQEGNDLLDGGPGSDVCVGGPGTNKLKSC